MAFLLFDDFCYLSYRQLSVYLHLGGADGTLSVKMTVIKACHGLIITGVTMDFVL